MTGSIPCSTLALFLLLSIAHFTNFTRIRRGGCLDTSCQSLALLWMCLTPEDVSRIRLGTLSMYTVESLRLLKRAFDVEFKVTPDNHTKTVLLSCLGTGYRNMAKAST
jgi:RNA 3'-terminal phosphate cyclase-like protein